MRGISLFFFASIISGLNRGKDRYIAFSQRRLLWLKHRYSLHIPNAVLLYLPRSLFLTLLHPLRSSSKIQKLSQNPHTALNLGICPIRPSQHTIINHTFTNLSPTALPKYALSSSIPLHPRTRALLLKQLVLKSYPLSIAVYTPNQSPLLPATLLFPTPGVNLRAPAA